MKAILVPLDGSELGKRAMPYAKLLAQAASARLILLHGVPPLAAVHQPGLERESAARPAETRAEAP